MGDLILFKFFSHILSDSWSCNLVGDRSCSVGLRIFAFKTLLLKPKIKLIQVVSTTTNSVISTKAAEGKCQLLQLNMLLN